MATNGDSEMFDGTFCCTCKTYKIYKIELYREYGHSTYFYWYKTCYSKFDVNMMKIKTNMDIQNVHFLLPLSISR